MTETEWNVRKTGWVKKEPPAPCQYTVEELKGILARRKQESHYYTQEEVKERLRELAASWE